MLNRLGRSCPWHQALCTAEVSPRSSVVWMNVSVVSDRVLKGNEFRFVLRCSPSDQNSGFLIAKGSTRRARPIRYVDVDTSDSRYWLSCSPWFGCYLNCIQRGFFGIGCVGFRLSGSLRCWFRMGIFEPSCWSFHQWIRFGLHGRLRSLFSTRFDRQFVRLR